MMKSRRGIMIPVAFGVVLVLLASAVAASTVGSASRRNVEVMRARRWARLAAASAFDEAALYLQAAVDVPMITGPRDLHTIIQLPRTVRPRLTQDEFRAQRIDVGDLTVATGAWTVQLSAPNAAGLLAVREMGVIELATRITVQCGAFRLSRGVRVRRFALAVPRGPGGREMIYMSPFDLVHVEDEKELP